MNTLDRLRSRSRRTDGALRRSHNQRVVEATRAIAIHLVRQQAAGRASTGTLVSANAIAQRLHLPFSATKDALDHLVDTSVLTRRPFSKALYAVHDVEDARVLVAGLVVEDVQRCVSIGHLVSGNQLHRRDLARTLGLPSDVLRLAQADLADAGVIEVRASGRWIVSAEQPVEAASNPELHFPESARIAPLTAGLAFRDR